MTRNFDSSSGVNGITKDHEGQAPVQNTTTKVKENSLLGPTPGIRFEFDGEVIRVVMIGGWPWFVAADVCRALKLKPHRKGSYSRHLLKLDDDEKRQVRRDLVPTTPPSKGGVADAAAADGKTPNGKVAGSYDEGPAVWVISESGLYIMMLRSNGAVRKGTVAHRFRGWVTRDVLPAIRATGSYSAKALPSDPLAAQLTGPGREELTFDLTKAARYVVTVFPNEPTHIRETPLDAILDEWSAFDTDILASHIRTVHALWQKTQLMRSIGADPAGSPLYDRLGATIIEGRRLADEYLRHAAIRPD
jgi:prophage antirepressor-like protein